MVILVEKHSFMMPIESKVQGHDKANLILMDGWWSK